MTKVYLASYGVQKMLPLKDEHKEDNQNTNCETHCDGSYK